MSKILGTLQTFRVKVPQTDWAFKVVSFVFVCTLLSIWTKSHKPQYTKSFVRQIESIVRYAMQSSDSSNHSTNPIVALMNVTTAIAYLTASKRMAKDPVIERITGVNVAELATNLEERQDYLIKTIGHACPSIQTTSVYTG